MSRGQDLAVEGETEAMARLSLGLMRDMMMGEQIGSESSNTHYTGLVQL